MNRFHLLLLAFCVSLGVVACDTAGPTAPAEPEISEGVGPFDEANLRPDSLPPVAVLHPNGEITLNTARLRRTFEDGGPIHRLYVDYLVDGYNLIRVGQEHDGSCRTEALPLVRKKKFLDLDLDELARKLFCSSDTCIQSGNPNDGFCEPSFAKQSCPCTLGGDCGIGFLVADDLAVLVFTD